jgi:hypothetical protein
MSKNPFLDILDSELFDLTGHGTGYDFLAVKTAQLIKVNFSFENKVQFLYIWIQQPKLMRIRIRKPA